MPRPITVTYTLHPAHGPQRENLLDALTGMQAQLPLRNLHWKPGSRTALRTIQEVDVRLVELGEAASQREVSGSVMDGALVNLCLVACDDADVYKNSTRSFIRDWLSLLSSRRNVYAPLIVLVNPPSARDTGKNVFGRDKGVLGKLKSDFNLPKRDRCAQVNLPSGNIADPAAWPEVMNRLKESIVNAFDAAILEREEEVKRGEAQRLTVGWNFCQWFLLKESLAHSFEGVGLHEDALIVYEELDASFLQILKEQNLSWFGKLGATGARDDSLPILDTTAKPYRELLLHSAISVFDFRIYVFARQAGLMGKLGRITEVAKRGQWFVASLARRLRESEGDLAELFIESWTYTACMDIVGRCDEWSRTDRPNGDYSGLIAYESARSELLDIARVQVERLGVVSGHLPDCYPYSAPRGLLPQSDDVLFESSDAGMSDDGADTDQHAASRNAVGLTPGRARPSNQHFVEALADAAQFRALYLSSTRTAVAAYEACGKANSAIRLKVDLAALALHTEDWLIAHDLSRSLVRDCAEQHTWEPIRRFALRGWLRAHEKSGLARDNEWAGAAVELLRSLALHEDQGRDGASDGGVFAEDESTGLQAVLTGLRGLDGQYEAEGLEAFSLRLMSPRASAVGDVADVIEVQISVRSMLEEDVDVDDVELVFEDANRLQLGFSTGPTGLQWGTNTLNARCYTSAQGVFHLASATIVLGATRLLYTQLESDGRLGVRWAAGAVRTSLRVPPRIALDEASRVVLRISTGQCEMRDVRVVLRSTTSDVYLDMEGAECDAAEIRSSAREMILDSLAKEEEVEIVMPYRGVPHGETIQAQVFISYTSPSDDGERQHVDVQSVFMGLPITVNVQDFFRPERLTSHFSIASDGREYLRVKSVELRADERDGYAVMPARKRWGDVIVTPERALSSLFSIRRRTDSGIVESSSKGPAVLRLVITYRNLEEEALQYLARQRLATGTAKLQSESDALGDRQAWLPAYARNGALPGLEAAPAEAVSLPWRTLEIPVEVPTRRLIVSARLTPQDVADPNAVSVHEGRAVVMRLSFRVGFAWSGMPSGSRAREQLLAFDVVPNPDEWIVLGRKKGSWVAKPDHEHSVDLTLVPMRPGGIALPSITVNPAPRRPRSRASSARDPRARFDDPDQPDPAGHGAEPNVFARGFAVDRDGDGSVEADDEDEDERDGPLICETLLENAAQVVRVLPAKRTMTAVVPAAPPAPMPVHLPMHAPAQGYVVG